MDKSNHRLSSSINRLRGRKLAPFHIWVLSVVSLLALFTLFIINPDYADKARSGRLNAAYIENRLPVALNGDWEYYDSRFLFSSDFSASSAEHYSPEYRKLPGTLPNTFGYGTYRLTFTFLGTTDLYSLRLAGVQGTARIYVDGRLLSDIGFTSSLKASSETEKDNQYIVFPLDIMRQTHEIIIQVSNFSNYHTGITSPIYFGTQIDGYRLASQFKFAESVGLMSIGILAILLIFLLFFKVQMGSTAYLLLFTIMLSFHLVYSSNNLLTQPVQSWTYAIFTKIYVLSFALMGLCMILLARQNCYTKGILQRTLKIYLYIIPFLLVLTLLCPGKYLPMMKILTGTYFAASLLHTSIILLGRIWNKSYSALMLMLSLSFCSSYFALLYFNSRGMVSADAYASSYIFLLVAYVTSQLAYVALKVSRIYTGNARLARRMVVTDKLKSEFISATSHELRTPLHGIINIIESASSKLGEPDTAKEQLSLALMLARKLNSVLNDLYGFYSSEHRSVSLKPVNLDIEVNAVIEVFYYTSDNTKLIFKNNLSKNALWVNADESKLWEVLNNIIGNAVKYTDSGTITISSKRMNGKVYVSVSDTGIGMSAKDISRIFDKSVRLDDTARKAEGVGLGLYLVRQLTEQMNGSVYVEWTKPGQGTCITFCLDACTPDHNSMENAAAAQAGSAYKSQNYLEDFKGTSASLLVVDDNEDNLNIIRTIFEDCSFSMDCVKSAKEALELLEKSSYDIIILDVMMPEMSGFELCQIIRKRYSHFELPVLLLTACDGAEEILTGFWSGANDYVVKPADRIELRTRVFSLITLKQSVKSALDNEMLFLQAQIRPHFLYNAFNTISAIALTDGVKASELIDDLAIYLRGCFGNDVNRGLVTIDTELGIVNSYVHIEQARFGRRLQFKLVQKTGRSFSLPPLTIQPLVENAIRHATLDSYQEIQIQVTITEKNEYIHIEIQDNGVGIEPVKIANLLNEEQDGYQGGIGLRNVSRRLKLHYGIPLDIQTSPGAGTTILIRIPLNSKFQEDELEYGYSSNQQHP